jgi:thioredoxin 1
MAGNFYTDVTEHNFQEQVLAAPQMVVVAFMADWSDTCQILKPELEALGQEYAGRVIFASVNVDREKALTEEWHIDGVPTLVFFNGGREIHRIKGVMMRHKLRRQVEGALLVT